MTPKSPVRLPDKEIELGLPNGNPGVNTFGLRTVIDQVTYNGGVHYNSTSGEPWIADGYFLSTLDAAGNVNLETAGIAPSALADAYLTWVNNEPFGSLAFVVQTQSGPNRFDIYCCAYAGRFAPAPINSAPVNTGNTTRNLGHFASVGGYFNGVNSTSFMKVNFGANEQIYAVALAGLNNVAVMPAVDASAIFARPDGDTLPMVLEISPGNLAVLNYDPNTEAAVACYCSLSGFAFNGAFNANIRNNIVFDDLPGAKVIRLAGGNQEFVYYVIDENGGNDGTAWVELPYDTNTYCLIKPTGGFPVGFNPGGYVEL